VSVTKMQVTISAEGDSGATNEFYNWLRLDSDIARSGTVSRQVGSGEGHMGVLELIDVVMSNGIALGSLIVAYASWRQARPKAPPVTFESGGVMITAIDASPETLRRIAEVLRSGDAYPLT
jgi:hypothetical protein